MFSRSENKTRLWEANDQTCKYLKTYLCILECWIPDNTH